MPRGAADTGGSLLTAVPSSCTKGLSASLKSCSGRGDVTSKAASRSQNSATATKRWTWPSQEQSHSELFGVLKELPCCPSRRPRNDTICMLILRTLTKVLAEENLRTLQKRVPPHHHNALMIPLINLGHLCRGPRRKPSDVHLTVPIWLLLTTF